MAVRRRSLSVVAYVAAALLAGCGGGGGGGTPSTPGGTPTGAPVFAVTTRPLHDGDTFAYAGSTIKSFVFAGASPAPSSSQTSSIAQAIVVRGAQTFNGNSNLYDFTTTETDTAPLQQIGITTDAYYAASGPYLLTYGYSSTDTLGERLVAALANVGAGSGIVDILPESAGQAWTNGNAQTLTETSPGNQSAVRTYRSDGSYVDTTTYATGIVGTITENSNGSGSYVFTNGGTVISRTSFAAPVVSGAAANIVIDVDGVQQTIPAWYSSPVALYAENDVQNGPAPIPPACGAAPAYGTTANRLVQTYTQVDTILGTLESVSQTNYIVPTYGAVCVMLSDRLQFFYDYTGQAPAFPSFASTPQETETITTTLGLASASVAPSSVLRKTSARAAAGLAIANARANFIASVQHEKNRFKRDAADRIVRSFSKGVRR